ncbi:MAG: 4-hydroxythreonine-4-phosphate dehydrogenase PdxA [Thermodesulfobacteriota bacterium]|jgi:4-hydroxythreonine-4-phosphate dehydrogenase
MTLPIIGITMGDPTGIGPEIIIKALSMKEPFEACRPIIFGDREILSKAVNLLGLPTTIEVIEKIPEEGYLPQRIFLLPFSRLEVDSFHFGKPDTKCGEAMVKYVEEAVKWVGNGQLDALTTCPINKQAINAAGYPYSGHTELLAHLTQSSSVAMMFLGSRWKVVFVTTHIPLKDVSKWISVNRVLSTIRITDGGLKGYFGITHPRIAVLGLNPHCGEDGLLGEEEKMAIIPAIAEARSQGVEAKGPFPADSFFKFTGHIRFDAVVSMYHDQGLIPIKMVDFDEAVNLTLGLPFVRTSVGHGTAYDIAGRGLANPSNLVKALLVASKLSKLKGDHLNKGF